MVWFVALRITENGEKVANRDQLCAVDNIELLG